MHPTNPLPEKDRPQQEILLFIDGDTQLPVLHVTLNPESCFQGNKAYTQNLR